MDTLPAFWHALGILGAFIFYTRFYVQWIYSEYKGRSEVPVLFWYLSALGSVSLLTYGVAIQSPIGTLSHCFNTVIYARNLIHIWNHDGTLTRPRYIATHVLVIAIATTAIILTALTWKNEIATPQPGQATATNYLWLAVGVIGQTLFALRFIIQWAATEKNKKSTIPPIFWTISLAAAALLIASHLSRQEYIYAIGLAATLLIYARNLHLIRRSRS